MKYIGPLVIFILVSPHSDASVQSKQDITITIDVKGPLVVGFFPPYSKAEESEDDVIEGLAQINAQGAVIEAESCSVELTRAGQGSWRGSFVYRGMVASDGRLSGLEVLEIPSSATIKEFVRLDQFEACVRRWRFAMTGSVTLTFEAGTTGDAIRHWSITVSGSKQQFRLTLPRR
jgi:hypothetical protein